MPLSRFNPKLLILVSAALVLAAVASLSVTQWMLEGAPPDQAQIDAFAQQDAIAQTPGEVCVDYRRWPVKLFYRRPWSQEDTATFKMMEDLQDVGLVTRTFIPSSGTVPPSPRAEDAVIFRIAPNAAPYVRERLEPTPAGGAPHKLFALCLGKIQYNGHAALVTMTIYHAHSHEVRAVDKEADGSYTCAIGYDLKPTVPFVDWVKALDRQLNGPRHQDAINWDAYDRLARALDFTETRRRSIALRNRGDGWHVERSPA